MFVIWHIQGMNISGIDLNLLLAFEALIDERHVSRAAKRVGLSQPAFSNAIARLRFRLADPLFMRTAHGMMPTPRAEQLAGPIRSALAQLRQTFEAPQSFDPSVSARLFRIGLSDDVELRLAPLFARSMLSGELQMQTRRLDWLFTIPESELRNGTLDCAIGYFPDARYLAPDLIMEPLSEENSVVISRRGHSMWKRKLTLHRFTMLDHAAVIYRNQLWGLIDNELAARGLRRRLRLALPHCLSVLHAVASSNLCMYPGIGRRGVRQKPQPDVLPRAPGTTALCPADGLASPQGQRPRTYLAAQTHRNPTWRSEDEASDTWKFVMPARRSRRTGSFLLPTRLPNHRGHHDAGMACTKMPTTKPARPLPSTNHLSIALHGSCD